MTDTRSTATECPSCRYTAGHVDWCRAGRTVVTVTAAELLPGDVVLDEHGDRDHAAFDVHTTTDGAVRIFTAVSDQDLGWPRDYTVPASTPFTVSR